MKKSTLPGWGLLLALAAVWSQASPAAAQAAAGCSDAEQSHEFDFWIGEWDVYSNGELAGFNRIGPILDGCVLQEMWSGAQGSAGTSLNFYNPQDRRWHQVWVWRNGTTLHLAGGLVDGEMILEGDSVNSDGAAIRNRITWTANPDGTVRQHWEASKDEGESWQTAFDGLYKKQP